MGAIAATKNNADDDFPPIKNLQEVRIGRAAVVENP
jgi:hypothetical protein